MLFDVESSGLDGLEFLPQLLSNLGEKKKKNNAFVCLMLGFVWLVIFTPTVVKGGLKN